MKPTYEHFHLNKEWKLLHVGKKKKKLVNFIKATVSVGRAAPKLGSHSRMIFPEFFRETLPPTSHLPLRLFYVHFLVADNNPSLSP